MMDAEEIRQQARKLLQQGYAIHEFTNEQDLKKIIEELQIHQIELELQNEELIRTQQILEQTQRKYLDLYDYAPVGYITFDPNGIILEMNLTASSMLGEPRRRLVGRTLTPYLTNDSVVLFYQHCHTVANHTDQLRRWECELTLRSDDPDKPRYVQLESVAAEEADTRQMRVRSAMIDITEQKLASEQLKISEYNWAALVNNTPDWIWAIDRDYKLLRANNALRDQVFANKGYMLQPGVDVFRVTPDGENEAWQRYYGQVLRGEQFNLEVVWDDEAFDISFNPIRDHNDVVGAVIYARNVSERKSIEQTLRQRNRELGTFAQTVALDLQNPINLVSGYADYIIKHGAFFNQDEPSQIGNKIKEAALHTSEVIDELLFLAGLQQAEIKPVSIAMHTLLMRTADRLEAKITRKNAVLNLPDTLPQALGYEPWVEKVWLNVLSLALEYGGQAPQLSIGGQVQAEHQVRYWVKSESQVLSKTASDMLFSQMLLTKDASVDQHGLGLSVVKGIVERLGGQIGAKAGAEQKIEFFFTLPQPDK
jgi:PAS domain S-box-containing protein